MIFSQEIQRIYPNRYCESILFTYILCVSLFATGLFLYGFFPIKYHDTPFATMNDVPTMVNNVKIDSNYLYKPIVQKIIFMVIDGLRWDFVSDAYKLDVMPFTRESVMNNSACLLQVKVNAPTVTMPRIKAMTSGAVSSFIDVALNFGKSTMTSDNILLQAKKHGHNLIFYGDDTWLKLFPNIFHRSEGTTSFFVSDYTEVDLNVTRHINDELYRHNDWSIMVLHYLGLDHIGHVSGPQSPLIKPKLNEMDRIIYQLAMRVQQWNENGIPSLLVVCGDHGMKNSGGHGGATPEEILVPLIAFGLDYTSNINNDFVHIEQVDIATTLAVMLGVPIPSSSVGSVSINMMKNLPSDTKLFILYYNAQNIFAHFKKLVNYEAQLGYSNYLKAIHMHTEWLSKSRDTVEDIRPILNKYNDALNDMKNMLVRSMIQYNVTIMSTAIIFMVQILIITLNCHIDNIFSLKKFIYWWIFSVGLWLLLNYIFCYEENDSCFIPINTRLVLIIFIIFTCNCYCCAKSLWSILPNTNWNYSNVILLIGIILHTVSLTGTSYIEEEHQTWYFFLTTFLMFQLFIHIQKLFFYLRRVDIFIDGTNVKKIVLLLIMQRVLRTLNSTGNKYAHLPDINGWLKNHNSNFGMSIILIIALLLLIMIGLKFSNSNSWRSTLIFFLITSSCIYLRHASSNTVMRPIFYPKSRGIHEVQIFWITVVGYLFYNCMRNYIFSIANNTQNLYCQTLSIIIQLWVVISALLHRPQNVILLPIQLMACQTVCNLLKSNKNKTMDFIIIYCLGNVFYFYQGNSNSLATVDVAAGYVGLQSFILPVTTLFLCINTFSAQILAYLMLLYQTLMTERNNIAYEKIYFINRRYIFLKIFSLTIYAIIITVSRYHLFVWSVFSPKLLYEAMYLTVLFCVIFIMQIFFLLKKNTE